MLSFILRRTTATAMVLLVSSFIVYQLTAISGDPLLELRGSRDPGVQARIAYLSDALMLEVPHSFATSSGLAGLPDASSVSVTWVSPFLGARYP